MGIINITGRDLELAISKIDAYSTLVGEKHGDADGFAVERARMDADFYQSQSTQNDVNFDSTRFDAFLGKEEDIYKSSKIIEQKTRPLSAFQHFLVSNEVPLGAKRFRLSREELSGQAKIHIGGSDIPFASSDLKQEDFNTHHIVIGVKTDYLSSLTSNFAGRSVELADTKAATRAIKRKINDTFWKAPDAPGMYGVLDHPWLAKWATGVKMGPGYAGSSAPVLAVLNQVANYPSEASGGTMSPDTCVTSPRIRNFLMNTERSANSDKTIGKFWTENNSYIKSVDEANELQNAGGPGIDYMLIYSNDIDSLRLEMVSGISVLPAQMSNFDSVKIMFATIGGAVMPNAGNAILLIIDTNV